MSYHRADDHGEAKRISSTSRRHCRARVVRPVFPDGSLERRIVSRLPNQRHVAKFTSWAEDFRNGHKRYFLPDAYVINQFLRDPVDGTYIRMMATKHYNELWEVEPDDPATYR
jgi:hypothetical protein